MNWRISWLVIYHVIGFGLAWWFASTRGSIRGAIVTLLIVIAITLAWLVWDQWLATRVLRWLKQNQAGEPPWAPNMWGEVVEAARYTHYRQQRQTRDAQEKLQVFLEAMQASPIGVVLLDEVGRMEWFNLIAAEHLGLQSPRDLEQHIIHLVRDPVFVKYWVQQQNGHGVTIQGRQHTAQHPVKLAVQFFSYGNDKRLLLSRDVTAGEQADRMRRDFVANVSHEIRTPLTVLSGFVETMQSVPLDAAETGRYLDLMAQQAQRMQVLVQDLLTLSRLEGNPPPDQAELADVPSILEQAARDAQALSAVLCAESQQPHTVLCHAAPLPHIRVRGSTSELRSAISNLLNNAVRYTPCGGRVEASLLLLPDGGLGICVQDNGPGIAREHLPRITERFYRVDRSRSRETGGTGLGLAIVKHVAQRHGGELTVHSEPGRGARFVIALPAQRVCLADNAPQDSAAAPASTTDA